MGLRSKPKPRGTRRLRLVHASRRPDTCNDQNRRSDTHLFRLNSTVTVWKHRRVRLTAKLVTTELRRPKSLRRNQHLSSTLYLCSGELHRSNRDLIRLKESRQPLETHKPKAKKPTRTTHIIHNRSKELAHQKAGDARLKEPSHPGYRTDDGGADEASTPRRQEPAAKEL